MADLEWHVMLATGDVGRPVVGRVEAVDPEGITLTPIVGGAGAARDEVTVRWDDVVYLMQCGPDRDDLLLDAVERWPALDNPPAST